jgi:hypothetical protein
MKATSVKQYQKKVQSKMSLYKETTRAERKAQVSKNYRNFFFNLSFFLSVYAVSIESDMSG